MAGRDIIVIGTSAGGVSVLSDLVAALPPALPAAVFIVCHLADDGRSELPTILSRRGPLLARNPRDGDPIYPGHVYVAPPDYHLLVQPGHVQLSHGPRENRLRPAIDPLFRTAARAYGPRVIGVILTGALNDGVAGLMAVRAAGGVGVVQDPGDAPFPGLPRQAREVAGADHVVPADRLPAVIEELVRGPVSERGSCHG
jgi:two-component system chemotaxis response regulator CheB